jgi:hypothetical protein
MWAKRERNSTFKVFGFLFQHLEHEALELYDNWSNHITNQAYFMDLTHGAHDNFQGGDNNVKDDNVKSQLTQN